MRLPRSDKLSYYFVVVKQIKQKIIVQPHRLLILRDDRKADYNSRWSRLLRKGRMEEVINNNYICQKSACDKKSTAVWKFEIWVCVDVMWIAKKNQTSDEKIWLTASKSWQTYDIQTLMYMRWWGRKSNSIECIIAGGQVRLGWQQALFISSSRFGNRWDV